MIQPPELLGNLGKNPCEVLLYHFLRIPVRKKINFERQFLLVQYVIKIPAK